MPRCFFCVPIAAEAARPLAAFAESEFPRWLTGWRLSLIGEADLHLTLRFFPEAEGERLPALEQALPMLAETTAPLALRAERVAIWPTVRQARVVVALIEGGEALAPVASAAEAIARHLGYDAEQRPFRAHLTLARVRAPGALPRASPPRPPPIAIAAQAVALWESLPSGSARRYRERLRAAFSGGEAGAV
ncbi:MAG: hypothetical protein KatS3mg125_1874 [Lysobacterales bacterium]|jgi:2'-5' RNA ligase|nr:MAG: hypothetical protein KatS3mg125_1874 [Xanthomonadales bacterium]